MLTATFKPKLNQGSQMVSEETFTANLVGSWSEVSLMDYWKRNIKKSRRKLKKYSSTQNIMRKESKERDLLSMKWNEDCATEQRNKVVVFVTMQTGCLTFQTGVGEKQKISFILCLYDWFWFLQCLLKVGFLNALFKNKNMYFSTCKGAFTGQM